MEFNVGDDSNASNVADLSAHKKRKSGGNVVNISEKRPPEEDYEHPDESVWIIAISVDGLSFILQAPNIHYSFFVNGAMPEDLPLEGLEVLPYGVHEVVFSFTPMNELKFGDRLGHSFNYLHHRTLWTENVTSS